MQKDKLGNLRELAKNEKVYTGEVIDPKKSSKTGVHKGDIIIKAVESIPQIVEPIANAYQSRQVTLQQKEVTKQLRIQAEERIEQFRNDTARMLSQHELEIGKLINEDSKHERETKLLLEQQQIQKEIELKRLEYQHVEAMKKLDQELEKAKLFNAKVEYLLQLIQHKRENGEDDYVEQKLLEEELQRIISSQNDC